MVLVAKNEVTLTNIFDGQKGGAGKSVTVVKTEYAYSNSADTQPQSGWTTTLPTASKGSYLWTKVTYSDNTSVVTYTYQGIDGVDGLSTYTHVAYARLDKSNEIGFGRDITTGRPYNGSTVKRTGGVSFTTSGGTSVGKHIVKALGTTGLNGWLYLKVRNTHNATTLVVRLNGMTGSSVNGSYTVLPGKDLTILAPVKCREDYPFVQVSFETHSTRVTDELSYDVYEIGLYPSSPFVDFSHSPVATSTHVGIYTDDLEASSNDISKYEWSSYILSVDDSSGVTNYAEDRDFELGRWKHSSGNLSSGGSASADYQDGVATVVLNSSTGFSQIQIYSRSSNYESESYSSTALNNLRLWDTYTQSVYVRFNTTPGPGVFACVRDTSTTGTTNQINLSPTGLQLSNMVAGEWYLLSDTFVLQDITNYRYRRIILGLNGYNGSVSFKKPELTKTTKYVDAGPAPEDSNTKVADKVSTTELDDRINKTSEDVRLAYEAAIADAILKQASAWEEEFKKYKNSVAEADRVAAKEYTATKTEVVAHKTALENGKIQWEGLNNFIEFTKNGTMIIRDKNGSGGAGLMIDSDTISFMSNDQRVSYYSSGELFVERGVFTTSTRTGRFIEMQSPSNPDSNVIRYVGP